MAYTTPRTWAALEQVTAAKLNVDLRDNETFLFAPPKVAASKAGNQSISDNTLTVVTFSVETYDTDTMHSTSTNTGRITCVTSGYYMFTAIVGWASDATSYRYANLALNAALTVIAESTVAPASGVGTRQAFSHPISLTAGDYIQLQVKQQTGGALNVDTATLLTATWIGGP